VRVVSTTVLFLNMSFLFIKTATITCNNTVLSSNTATTTGGVMFVTLGSITCKNTEITANSASSGDGGAFNVVSGMFL
jgi:hypothetical protein